MGCRSSGTAAARESPLRRLGLSDRPERSSQSDFLRKHSFADWAFRTAAYVMARENSLATLLFVANATFPR